MLLLELLLKFSFHDLSSSDIIFLSFDVDDRLLAIPWLLYKGKRHL